ALRSLWSAAHAATPSLHRFSKFSRRLAPYAGNSFLRAPCARPISPPRVRTPALRPANDELHSSILELRPATFARALLTLASLASPSAAAVSRSASCASASI